ncbi:MAG: hypothetical protein DMF51_17290 [Acidobacteria bacterium]|nr:MAG: hypothetical protein DMF51_17290 [Acidobacteriota bacterium]
MYTRQAAEVVGSKVWEAAEEAIVTLKHGLGLGGFMVAMATISIGCMARLAPAAEGPPAFESGYASAIVQPEGISLFKGDSAVLTDADIARILSFSFTVRPQNRLAVMTLGRASLWSEEYAKGQADNARAFMDRLKAAHAVREVAELPMLLVPEKQTVPYLREAGARFQADLLLVHQSRVRTFSKYRTLGKDEVKALCTVEAILLDVRTGIIPYTTSDSETISAKRGENDLNFEETVAKATVEAMGKAMNAVADNMATFLDSHADK